MITGQTSAELQTAVSLSLTDHLGCFEQRSNLIERFKASSLEATTATDLLAPTWAHSFAVRGSLIEARA